VKAASVEHVAGTYRQRLTLASGRFAVIDNGLGFQLVPWSRELEKRFSQHVTGVAKDGGGIEWGIALRKESGTKLTPHAVGRSLKSLCASLGDELELLPLSFGWLLARRILARLDEVSPRLQHLAASLDHLAIPTRKFSLIADTV